MTLAPGTQLGPYEIVSQLGQGGMGVVYQATDPRLRRTVAIKLLPPDLTRDETAKQRFLQEAQAASALDHPNICTIFEINETDDGQLYLVMAHYQGETLKERTARGPLELDDAIDIATQVGEGLAKAHAAGIVHRDIKPANLMVTAEKTVKILDFGLAKLAGTEGMTQTGTTLGTVAYMSPEQAKGQEVDHRTDIWSLGVVLYEMLAGQPPFQGENLLSISNAILEREQPTLTGPSSSAQSVVRKALSKDRGQRYQSATDFLEGLREAPNGPASTSSTGSEVPSIAVLPFADMSPGKDQDYFCDGLTEELIDAFARLDNLRVVGRTSSFQFRGRGHDLREIGEKLGVTTVLEGSVRKAGSRLRINAQLINTTDGYHMWSERYDRQLEDVFGVQDDVSRAIVDVLKVKLLPAATREPRTRPTKDMQAYQLYLQGRHHWNEHSQSGYDRALEYFDKAIERDPTYPMPHVGRAHSYLEMGFFESAPPIEVYPKAKEAALKALALDESNGDAHSALGGVLWMHDWNWDDADEEFRRALELAPQSIVVLQAYGLYQFNLRRPEAAITNAERQLALDPLSIWAHHSLGVSFYAAHRFDEAEAQFKATIERAPHFLMTHAMLGLTYLEWERSDQAVTVFERAADLAGASPLYLSVLGYASALTGNADRARDILQRLDRMSVDRYVAPSYESWIHTALGDTDSALDCLDRAYEERAPMLVALPWFVGWDPLRADPRFQALLQRMNFPATASPDASTGA